MEGIIEQEFNKYKYLAVHIAKRYVNAYIDVEDLIQGAYLGLVTGLNKCNLSNDKHKVNYLSKYIISEIIKTIKTYNDFQLSKEFLKASKLIRENENLSINEISEYYDISVDILYDALNYQKQEKITDIEIPKEDKDYMLSKREKRIYRYIVLENKSLSVVCKKLKISKEKLLEDLKIIYSLVKS